MTDTTTPPNADMPAADAATAPQSDIALGRLSRIKVNLTVEVGHARLTLEDLLRLNEGAVVELDRMAGDPLDILVNGTQIARGEVVVVGERFGIRFSEIVDPKDRIDQI
ncbi:flagellar motor switch protein FliN [Roseovarius sp.]|jgi:flagellar motor switch protein FliN/FliY